MVDRMKDKADIRLETMFRSDTIDDGGFSERVVTRIRHKIWIRRWTLPIAIVTGALIAVKPAAELLTLLPVLMSLVPDEMRAVPADLVPQFSTLAAGAVVAGVMALVVRALED